MKNITLFILAIIVLTGCGEKVQEAKNAYNVISNIEKVSQNYEESVEKANNKWEERRKKGDTLALDYKELQKFLPSQISDYSIDGEPEGSTTTIPGMSFSTGEQRYIKGDDYIKVSIYDYNGSENMFLGATAIYASGLSFEDDYKKTQTLELGVADAKGWEEFKKKENIASLTIGVGERFLISIEASNQADTELVKSIAKEMDLESLASI